MFYIILVRAKRVHCHRVEQHSFLLCCMQVSESICSLMSHDSQIAQEMPHVERVFTMMDSDGDGVVTKEDFFQYCITTNTVRQSLAFLPWICFQLFLLLFMNYDEINMITLYIFPICMSRKAFFVNTLVLNRQSVCTLCLPLTGREDTVAVTFGDVSYI